MTSELRPAMAVWADANLAYHDALQKPKTLPKKAAAAVIEADREAVRAPLLAEIERLTLTVRKLQGNQAALEAELAKFKALAETLAGALELADCALSGVNMNMNVVERKVREALREYKEARDAS